MAAFRIAVVCPAGPMLRDTANRVLELAAALEPPTQIIFHPQCFAMDGHFAGADEVRAAAFLEAANDPSFDAVWFGRGGYGAGRLLEAVMARLAPASREKAYLGYSDAGSLLAALYRAGHRRLAHGPMANDILREGGDAAVRRALAWLTQGAAASLEPSVDGRTPTAAFNLAILAALMGTPWEPDLAGHVLMLEEVSEHLYRIDRLFWQVTSSPKMRRLAGLRLGRCSDIPENDPEFGKTADEIAKFWCERSGIAWLGGADIGHDAANKVVPFGLFP